MNSREAAALFVFELVDYLKHSRPTMTTTAATDLLHAAGAYEDFFARPITNFWDMREMTFSSFSEESATSSTRPWQE